MASLLQPKWMKHLPSFLPYSQMVLHTPAMSEQFDKKTSRMQTVPEKSTCRMDLKSPWTGFPKVPFGSKITIRNKKNKSLIMSSAAGARRGGWERKKKNLIIYITIIIFDIIDIILLLLSILPLCNIYDDSQPIILHSKWSWEVD